MKKSMLIQPTRRSFCKYAAMGLAGLAAGTAPAVKLLASEQQSRFFRFAFISDTHIIDEFYDGVEGNNLDSESIFYTYNRLAAVRDTLNAVTPSIDLVLNAGDLVHNYPSDQYNFFFENVTRWDRYKELIDGFNMPVHSCLGNHDYDIGDISRQFTHDLAKAKLAIDPYYSVDHRGWKFIAANNFLGDSMDPGSSSYDNDAGSFGEEQLNWIEAELEQGAPTILFFHFPMFEMRSTEIADYGIVPLVRKYRDTIKMVVAGHVHRWYQLGDIYGPLHYTVASSRYDKSAYMIFEVDTVLNTFRVLNWRQIHWGTVNSDPYVQKD